MANLHVPIRAGSDIAFLGGIVNYIFTHERWFHEYVVAFTNAATLIKEEFRDTEDLDGLFSGWQREQGRYDIDSWQYEGVDEAVPAAGHKELFAEKGAGQRRKSDRGRDLLNEKRDETLQDPRCVFQIVRRHFSRYTPEMV